MPWPLSLIRSSSCQFPKSWTSLLPTRHNKTLSLHNWEVILIPYRQITAVREQVTLFAHSVKGGNARGSGARRKVANEVSVSCIIVTFEWLLFMGNINYDCLEITFFRLQSRHYIILQIISLADLNCMLYLLCSTL